jgi:hypothetical protein
MKNIIFLIGITLSGFITLRSHSQSIYDNTYDANSRNGVREKSGNRVYLISSKKMTPYDISFYSGFNTNAGHIEGNKWVVDIASGYGQFGSPFYMDQTDRNYSFIVEYEIAAVFDKKYRAPFAFIEIFNNGNVINDYPINQDLGSINGENIQYTKIRFKTENIPSAFDLQPRLRTYLQDNKKIYINSVSYFLTKPVY